MIDLSRIIEAVEHYLIFDISSHNSYYDQKITGCSCTSMINTLENGTRQTAINFSLLGNVYHCAHITMFAKVKDINVKVAEETKYVYQKKWNFFDVLFENLIDKEYTVIIRLVRFKWSQQWGNFGKLKHFLRAPLQQTLRLYNLEIGKSQNDFKAHQSISITQKTVVNNTQGPCYVVEIVLESYKPIISSASVMLLTQKTPAHPWESVGYSTTQFDGNVVSSTVYYTTQTTMNNSKVLIISTMR